MHRFHIPVVLPAVLLIFTAACDNPVESEHDDDHAHVAQFILVIEDDTLVTVQGGEITGIVTLPAGASTSPIAVEFADEDGDPIHGEDLDESFNLSVEVADDDVLAVELTDRWAFTLTGLEPGETTIDVSLRHVTHEEFGTPSPGIPVTVE